MMALGHLQQEWGEYKMEKVSYFYKEICKKTKTPFSGLGCFAKGGSLPRAVSVLF